MPFARDIALTVSHILREATSRARLREANSGHLPLGSSRVAVYSQIVSNETLCGGLIGFNTLLRLFQDARSMVLLCLLDIVAYTDNLDT